MSEPSLIRPNVGRMVPYSPGKPIEEVRRELGLERIVKLASNENPLGPSPNAVEAIREAAAQLHLYPDASGHDLVHAIAAKHGIAPSQVVLGNGSDELIHLLGLITLAGPGDRLVMGHPSFVRYEAAAQIADAELVHVPVDADFRLDLNAMAKACDERTKLVFVANPNNPTGTIVRECELRAFLADLPETTLAVLDEAYFEFAADESDFPNGLDLLREGHRVFVMRTFSKAYGLAGIRIGYGFGSESVVDAIHRAREPFNVNSLAQAAAIAALGDDEHLQKTLSVNREGMARIEAMLVGLGGRCSQSFANFVYADMGRPVEGLFQGLLRRGVIIRAGRPMGGPNALRITIGTPEEVSILEEALAGLAW
ncbi:MAG: histidinol-phosphate transaminase [Fimbriimonadaceae bacterium]|nr:histidinol-phosphate transaminase [Fimbriimonadaceae bacterium]